MSNERRRLLYGLAAWEDYKLEHYGTEQAERAVREIRRIHDELGEMSDPDMATYDRARRFYIAEEKQ